MMLRQWRQINSKLITDTASATLGRSKNISVKKGAKAAAINEASDA